MSNSPVNQIGESQRSTLEMCIQPDTKIMQTDFGSQARLKARQGMRAFTCQAEGIEQFVVDGFDQLTPSDQPPPPGFRPFPLARLVRRRDHLRPKAFSPESVRLLSSKSLVSQIDAPGFSWMRQNSD